MKEQGTGCSSPGVINEEAEECQRSLSPQAGAQPVWRIAGVACWSLSCPAAHIMALARGYPSSHQQGMAITAQPCHTAHACAVSYDLPNKHDK